MANKSGVLFLIREDGSRTTLTNAANGEPLGRVYGISKDSRGNFWLSSKDNGLFKMTPNTAGGYSIVNFCHNDDDNYSLSDNRAYTAVEDKQGNIWIATYGGGVNLLKKDSTRFISYLNEMKNYPRNSHKKVRTLALDRDGKVWAGTTDGILIMSYQKGLLNINRLEESKEYPDSILMSNDVVCLERDQNGMMWVGTNGGGLAHTTGQDSDGCWIFEHFGYKNGLPSEEIRSITTDQRGNVWFSTENELCSYDTQKNSFSTFTELEGVDETICSEGAALALPNNVILFGTVDGYYIVDCDKLAGQTKASRLKLHLTDFWVNGELQSPHLNNFLPYYVPEATEVELPKGTKEFSIRFASLNYQLQHRVHYQYMLEGYDKTWNNAGKDRMGTYSNLSSGTYTLKVRAYLMETGEKHNEIKLTIIIHGRPFYAHWWFWFIILLLIGVAAGGGYWWLKHRSSSPAKKKADDSVSDQADQPVEEEEIIEAEQIDVF
jgi:sugar lactone lactonase YvrE